MTETPTLEAERPAMGGIAALGRRLLGRADDWNLRRPTITPPRPGLHWVGPLLLIASFLVPWVAFDGARGEDGNVAFGLWVGATSIVLMAWSFVLALRPRSLEPLFGGLDSMYRAHRWAGSLAVVAVFLHTSAEPEIEGGILGASQSVAGSAEDFAGTGETLLYILVGLSLLRWIPYRWWRLSHKLLGVPFAFACWHFYTAEKPYENDSGWGMYFNLFMLAGLTAYVGRVIIRDVLRPGRPYKISEVRRHRTTTELELVPEGRALRYRAGQFAVLKIQRPGLREPHVFTIASAPSSGVLRFYIRDLGDWTARIQDADLKGAAVIVEGPYGEFAPHHPPLRSVWIAGGVGITPFLAAIDDSGDASADSEPPVLFYCVRRREDATAIEFLETAASNGLVDLRMVVSSEGSRFGEDTLVEHFGPGGLRDAHVAVCGPAGLVSNAVRSARSAGASSIEREGFDIRAGFGPDLSKDIDRLTRRG